MFKLTINSQKEGQFWLEKQTQTEVDQYLQWAEESAHWGKPAWIEEVPEKVELEVIDGVQHQKTTAAYQIVHPAEYEITVEDITADITQAQINKDALEFLAASDWYLIREMETGVKMPDEIREERAKARASIVH